VVDLALLSFLLFLTLLFLLLLFTLILDLLFTIFNRVERLIGERLSRLLFAFLFLLGLLLLLTGWISLNPCRLYLGALFLSISAFYFLSESFSEA
jgi:hypothetical protein